MKYSLLDFKLTFFVSIVLIFFAANSILARMAISTNNIDAFSFTFIRIFFASLMLILLYIYKNRRLKINLTNNYLSGLMFFLYAIFFSYSYENLYASVGTLILYAVVQISMIIIALFYS